MNFNAYYNDSGSKSILVDPANNTQPSAEECCISCHENKKCNAWVWCPLETGCNVPAGNRRPGNATFPYEGCELLKIQAFSPYDDRFSTDFKILGPNIPFVAGSPLNISVPSLPDYEVLVGVDLAGQHDYECASLGTSPCLLRAPASDIAAACNSDAECEGFVYFPEGINFDGSGPVGVLKRTGKGTIARSDTVVDPTAATYIKKSLSRSNSEGSGSSSSGSTVTIAVVASIGGILIIAGIIGSILYVRRYRQMKRSFPDNDDVGMRNATGDAVIVASDGKLAADVENIGMNQSEYQRKHSQSSSNSDTFVQTPSIDVSRNDDGLHRPTALEQNIFVNQESNVQQMPPALAVVDITELPAGPPPESLVRMMASKTDPALAAENSANRELFEAFTAAFRRRDGNIAENALASLSQDRYVNEEHERHRTTPSGFSEASYGHERSSSRADVPRLSPSSSSSSSNEVSISPQDVEICRRPDGSFWELGAGAFGRVYKGRYRSMCDVAVKVLHPVDDPRTHDTVLREVSLLQRLRHRNVVRLIGACLDGPGGTALLLTELMDLGDLWRALPARTPSGERIFSWWLRGRNVIEDVARGLAYLHAHKIVHFDLKSANILLNQTGTAKIADIGMARVLCKSYFSVISGLGTFAWSAPEVLAGRRCSEMADIYSFGVVLWEVCTGEPPVRGHMRPLQPGKDCPPEVVDLQHRCVSEDAHKRPSAQEVVSLLATLSS